MKRTGWIGLLALVVGGSGCAGTAKRDDGGLMFKPRAWSAAPAPEQVEVASKPSGRADTAAFAPKGEQQGLTRYFPGLRKGSPESTKVTSTYRPSWFGLRKVKPQAQVYTTDARAGLYLGRGPADPPFLPVALRVPTDASITTTAAKSDVTPSAGMPDPVAAGLRKPTDEGMNPASAARTEAAKPVNPMPDVPAINPRPSSNESPAPSPAAEPEQAEAAASDVAGDEGDAKTAQAAATPADPARSLGLPEPTLPVSYVRRETMSAPGHGHAHTHTHAATAGPVLASPQVAPTSKVGGAPPSAVGATPAAKKWQRPCLRRLVRKTWKLGESACPPTAKPH